MEYPGLTTIGTESILLFAKSQGPLGDIKNNSSEHKNSSRGEENVLQSIAVMIAQFCEYPKKTEYCTL